MKNIIITGATSGIGKATAHAFAKSGHRLILTGRRKERLEQLVVELSRVDGVEAYGYDFDVRSYDECKSFAERVIESFGPIDLLVNNAGLAQGFASIEDGDISDWNTMIDTNVKGLAFMTKVIAPSMIEAGSGHIINICSTAGHEVYPGGNMYCASKHAVDALTKSTRLDLYKHGIRVSQVSPGHVEETEFALVRFHGDEERASIYNDFNPLTSKDVAETIYFIASQPKHVNIQDVLMMGTQQAGSNFVDRSGRKFD